MLKGVLKNHILVELHRNLMHLSHSYFLPVYAFLALALFPLGLVQPVFGQTSSSSPVVVEKYENAKVSDLQVQAEAGDAEAQYHLALRYKGGSEFGILSHKKLYRYWRKRAIEQRHVPSIKMLIREGASYGRDEKKGFSPDFKNGFIWSYIVLEIGSERDQFIMSDYFRKAKKYHNYDFLDWAEAAAKNWLQGKELPEEAFYVEENGLRINSSNIYDLAYEGGYENLGFEEIEALANESDPVGQFFHALSFRGRASEKLTSSREQYLLWMERSADQLYLPAVALLARDSLYASSPLNRGQKDVDLETAYMWFMILERIGFGQARKNAAELLRRSRSYPIRRRHFEPAEKRARAWLVEHAS